MGDCKLCLATAPQRHKRRRRRRRRWRHGLADGCTEAVSTSIPFCLVVCQWRALLAQDLHDAITIVNMHC